MNNTSSKVNDMKKIFLPLLVFIFLAACAPQQVTVTSEVTVTSLPAPSPVPPAPSTATATEAASPTPTESIDPETGWVSKKVNGETWLKSPDLNGEWVVRGGSAPLLHNIKYYQIPDAFRMEVYYLVGFNGPIVSLNSNFTTEGNNFTSYFLPKIDMRDDGHLSSDINGFIKDIKDGNVNLSFTTPQGPQSFEVSTNSKYRVYIMPYDQMPDGYQEWKSAGYKWIAKGDGTNAIAIIAANNPWQDMSKNEFMSSVMYPLAAMMTPKQSIGLYTPTLQAYAAGYQDYVNSDSLLDFEVDGLK